MAYLGNTPSNQSFTPAIDYFSGNGVTVAFTLTRPVASASQMIVTVDNVVQNPSTAFTVSSNIITFTSAPLSGTNNIWIEYTSLITTYAAISQDPSVVGSLTASGGYLANGNYGNSFVDGTIVDYVTGNGRITVGSADGITLYNGGPSARTALAAWDTSGNLTNTGGAVIQGLTVGKGGGSQGTSTTVGAYAGGTQSVGYNTAVGYAALNAVNSGNSNTAIGVNACNATTTGVNNTAVGNDSLKLNTTGGYNTAVGLQALTANTASENTGVGYQALGSNTSGTFNAACGLGSLKSNTTGGANTAFGYQAGYSNTTTSNNTAVGYKAGYASTGSYNTFLGKTAGTALSSGDENLFLGNDAGVSQTSASRATYVGANSGASITTGSGNVILGSYNGNQGGLDIRTQSNYIVVSDGNGNPKFSMDSSGIPAFTGLYAHTTSAGANVYVDGNTTLYRSTSSLKYKTNVQDATHGLAEVMALRPVTYSGIGDIDSDKTFGGLIAEEVHEAGLTEFVQYAEDGSPDALAYGHMVSLCVKAIQELKAEVDSLKAQLEAK